MEWITLSIHVPGLSSSPRVLTRLMKFSSTTFREEGMQCVFYLYDGSFVSECYDKCYSDTMKVVDVLTNAGFFTNYDNQFQTLYSVSDFWVL